MANLEDKWTNMTVRYHKPIVVQVGTHKSGIVMWLPEMEHPLWMTARDAEELSKKLHTVALYRKRLDKQAKAKGR